MVGMDGKFAAITGMARDTSLNIDEVKTDSHINIFPASPTCEKVDTSKTETNIDIPQTDVSAFVNDGRAEKEKFKIETLIEPYINLNRDQFEVHSPNKIWHCFPKSENEETSSNDINLERPQTSISAFFKEETSDEEKFKAVTVIAEEMCLNGVEVKMELDIHDKILPCSPVSDKEGTCRKNIDLDIPQTLISAFFKEERAEDNDDDEQSETDDKKTSSDSTRTLAVESLNKQPVLLLSRIDDPKINGGYLPSYSALPKPLNENTRESSSSSSSHSAFHEPYNENTSESSPSSSSKEDSSSSFSCSFTSSFSSSSDSLGYDSGSEDFSDLVKKNSIYCLKCNKAFQDTSSFNYHSEAHHSKKIKCSHCNRIFRTEKMLKRHKENLLRCHEFIRTGKLFSNKVSSTSTNKSQSDGNSSKVTLRLVPTHKLMKATDEENLANIFENPIDATVDELDSSSISGFPEGAISENGFVKEDWTKISCKICRSVFISMSDLKVHFVTHTERKDCICGHCGKCFKNEKELHTHTENLNTGHVFLQSGQVSYASFFSTPSYIEEVSCFQKTVDERDIKQIIIKDEYDISTPPYSSNIS